MTVAGPGRSSELVTLGETMAMFSGHGLLRHARSLAVSLGGSESNVAVAVCRLGHGAAWIARVGDDEWGRLILRELGGEGIDLRSARMDSEAKTGLMFKEHRTADSSRVSYYRAGSAGSRLEPGDIDEGLVRAARVLHVTGITPALSASARAAVLAAVELARAAGVLVSLDLNYRSALWTADEARPVLRDMTRRADLVFGSEEEVELVVGGAGDPEAAARALAALGPARAVVKRGDKGALALADGELTVQPAMPVRAVDAVGAGDGFVGGYLAGLLRGLAAAEALRVAAVAGAFAVTVHGDWEGLPSWEEIVAFTGEGGLVIR